MFISIKRIDGTEIASGEYPDMKEAVEDCARKGVSLEGADLRGADLRGANLFGVGATGARFKGANLEFSNFCHALLSASIEGSDALTGAILSEAIFDPAS
jgi:uncharacterized protein YjbI with pentapeptide repeats